MVFEREFRRSTLNTWCEERGALRQAHKISDFCFVTLQCFFLPEENVARARAHTTVDALNMILVIMASLG